MAIYIGYFLRIGSETDRRELNNKLWKYGYDILQTANKICEKFKKEIKQLTILDSDIVWN